MFSWLKKSSKEPKSTTDVQAQQPPPKNEPVSATAQPNVQPAPIQNQNQVYIDHHVKVKPLTPTTQNEQADEDDSKEDLRAYRQANRANTITAERPYVQAQQHLQKQEKRRSFIQKDYMSDHEESDQDDDEQVNEQPKKKRTIFKPREERSPPPPQPQDVQTATDPKPSASSNVDTASKPDSGHGPMSQSTSTQLASTAPFTSNKPTASASIASSTNPAARNTQQNTTVISQYSAMAPQLDEQMKNNPYFQPVIDVNQFANDPKPVRSIQATNKSSPEKDLAASHHAQDMEKRHSARSQSLALDSNNPKFVALSQNKQSVDTMVSTVAYRQPRRQFMLDTVTKSKPATAPSSDDQPKAATQEPSPKPILTNTSSVTKTRSFAKRENSAKDVRTAKTSVNVNANTNTNTNTNMSGNSHVSTSSPIVRRRRSSGKKNRSFTPESVANVLPPKIEENTASMTAPPQFTSPPEPAAADPMRIARIEEWMKANSLWFSTEKGQKLLNALVDSGIEDPEQDLSILSAYPDLHEIAAMAGLNILQRRKFINAAHAKVNQFDNIKNQAAGNQPAADDEETANGAEMVKYRKGRIDGSKQVVVMSAEEQEALARMDSVIEQLQNTRNLIKKRIASINRGGLAYEKIIRSEFEILKDLLTQREEQLVDEMKFKIKTKITNLSTLDRDLLLSLQQCQKSKIEAQKLMKTNEQPRVSRPKWRVLMGRKKKVTNLIEDAITNEIVNHQNEDIAKLIIYQMRMQDIMPTLPQPLIAQHLSHNFESKSNKSTPYAFPHHHQRHYDELNPYLLQIFTKNQAQLHLQMSVPGFAFNYTQRSQMHKLLTEYGMISDVEEHVKEQLRALFPRQFDGMTNEDILNETKDKRAPKRQATKSINLKVNKKSRKSSGGGGKHGLQRSGGSVDDRSPSPSPQPESAETNDAEDASDLRPLPVGKSDAVLPHNVTNAKMILINPEDYERQIQKYLPKKKKDKKDKSKQKPAKPNISESKAQNDADWKPYATLQINMELEQTEQSEWDLIEKRLKQLEQQALKKERRMNKYSDDQFNQIEDIEEKETFKIQRFFANIIDKSKNVVTTKRIKEVEIQIGMVRKSMAERMEFEESKTKEQKEQEDAMEVSPSPNTQDNAATNKKPEERGKHADHSTLEDEQSEREIGWISLGWMDIQKLTMNATQNETDKEAEKERKRKEKEKEREQIPDQYKAEYDEEHKKDEEEEDENARTIKIPFLLEKQFQELMTQTYLASLELAMMLNEDDDGYGKKEISKEKMEQLIMEQLANEQLFEFNSRNVDEFEKNFSIYVRTRCRDRIHVQMTGMDNPRKPPAIFNKNANVLLPLQKQAEIKSNEHEEKDDEKEDNANSGDNVVAVLNKEEDALRECNLIVFQSSFTVRESIRFSLLRPVVLVLKERKLDSNHVNGFISIVGNESLQFIDPVTSSTSTLSIQLPPDVDSCGLIIDFIRFKHPAITDTSYPRESNKENEDDETEDQMLTSKLRNASKKLSVIRIGGAEVSSENERVLTGRLDIYNVTMNSWVMVGELNPARENMGCTMFYGRVCVTGGNVANNNFEPTALCEEFSFTERKWKKLKSMNIGRFGHCQYQFDEKPTKLFVYGGEIEGGDWSNSVEVYDPQKRQWFLKTPSKFKRYGASCCVWKFNEQQYVIVIGGQSEHDESSKHVEIYNPRLNKWNTLNDLNYEHGIFPAVWCDSDDNCIYIASQYIVIDQKNKQNSIIKYRVEVLDHPNNKWRIVSARNKFKTNNCYQILKSSATWNANAIRKSCGASIKVAN